jgi:hypothetical protein
MFYVRIYFCNTYRDLIVDEFEKDRITNWFYGQEGDKITIQQKVSTYHFHKNHVGGLVVSST